MCAVRVRRLILLTAQTAQQFVKTNIRLDDDNVDDDGDSLESEMCGHSTSVRTQEGLVLLLVAIGDSVNQLGEIQCNGEKKSKQSLRCLRPRF